MTIVCVVAILVILLAIWRQRQSAVSGPASKTAQASSNADSPKSAALPPASSVSPISPKLSQLSSSRKNGSAASASSDSSAPAASSATAVSPQAELPTAFADLAHDYRSGDIKTLLEDYMTPDTYAAMAPGGMEQIVQAVAQDPNAPRRFELQAEMFDSMEDQTPTYNAAGDEATYDIQPPPELTDQNHQTWQLHFTKINGHWYWADIIPDGRFKTNSP